MSDGHGYFRHQLCDSGADHLCAKNFAIRLVDHQLHKSLTVTRGECPATGTQGELSNRHLAPSLARLGLRQSHACDLRFTVDAPRHAICSQRLRIPAGHGFCRSNTPGRGRMSQKWRSHEIADGEDVGHGGAPHAVRL